MSSQGKSEDHEGVSCSSLGKKLYRTPQVFEYGTLREITLTVGNHGKSDGGSGQTSKTMP